MQKYRITYDRHLNAWKKGELRSETNGFYYNDEHIIGISVYFEFSVFENGKEIFFTVEDGEMLVDQYFDFGVEGYNPTFGSFLSNALKFIVDPNEISGYRLEQTDVAQASKYKFKFRPNGACKWVDCWNNPVEITYEEFVDILTNNMEWFDNTDNKPAQNCAYFAETVE